VDGNVEIFQKLNANNYLNFIGNLAVANEKEIG